MASTDTQQPVAEDLSRMEGTYGKAVIGKLKKMNVLIIGLRGLGIEIAKNLVLAGPRSITLHDDEKVAIADLGTNFYLKPSDVGTPRAAASFSDLADANPNCRVSVHTGEMDAKFLSSFNVVVATDNAGQEEQVRRNNAVRERKTENSDFETAGKYIYAVQNGLFTTVFSDFGNHVIQDPDGVPVNTLVLDRIETSEGKPTVCVIDSESAKRHGFYNGDTVKLEEVVAGDQKEAPEGDYSQPGVPLEGKSSIFNTNFVIKQHRVDYKDSKGKSRKRTIHTKFDIADCSGAGAWKSGGMVTGVKVPIQKTYESLQQQLDTPTFEQGLVDFSKFGINAVLHYARLALWAFQAKNDGQLPKLHDSKDAEAVVAEAKALLAARIEAKTTFGYLEELNERHLAMIKNAALYARTEVTAMSALWGGVVAQEIVKYTGKYTPIKQWIHFDAFELLQPKVPLDATPTGSRYDHQISLFGKAAQTKIMKSRLFLVGCGALGCEFLKGLALSGYGCGGGRIDLTDMDTIELSNLSRQFLFRRKHVLKPKSTSASEVIKGMNPAMASALDTKLIKVAPSTEDVFNAQFWDGLDFVVNALDNIQARAYVDSKCTLHGLPLFESGTLGTQANTAIALPHVTTAYSEGAVAGEDAGIAQCTLKSFPSLPLHCIEYAKEKFEESFTGGAQKLADFLEDRKGFLKRNAKEGLGELSSLQELKSWLDIYSRVSLETCVQLSMDSMLVRFRNGIRELQSQYPADARSVDENTGADLGPFWKGHKRFPQAIVVDAKNEAQADYLWHATCIFSDIFCLDRPTREQVVNIASGLDVPEWKATGAKIVVDNDEEEKASFVSDEDAKLCADLKAELMALDLKTFEGKNKVVPTDFEKDDDTNHHIAWITSASCLRAWNYKIPEPTFQTCRMIAGKIIPAIATTTAAITGFIQLEMLKYVTGRPLEAHRGVTLDLAVNSFICENLPDPVYNKSTEGTVCQPEKFTIWDHVDIVAPRMSIEAFAKLLASRLNVNVETLIKVGGDANLYTANNPVSKANIKRARRMFGKTKSATNKMKWKEIIDNYERFESENDTSVDIITKCEDLYGPVIGANFVVLQGTYGDAEYNTVVMPNIKYTYC